MRKTLFLLLITVSTVAFGQTKFFKYNKCIDGYWGSMWLDAMDLNQVVITGGFDEFVIHQGGKHPSEYIMKVTIQRMTVETDKKKKKIVMKSKNWYEYSGTVEYFSWKENPNGFKDIVKSWPFGALNASFKDSKNAITYKVPATIKIAPYMDKPEVYNIWFEGYGIGIDFKR